MSKCKVCGETLKKSECPNEENHIWIINEDTGICEGDILMTNGWED